MGRFCFIALSSIRYTTSSPGASDTGLSLLPTREKFAGQLHHADLHFPGTTQAFLSTQPTDRLWRHAQGLARSNQGLAQRPALCRHRPARLHRRTAYLGTHDSLSSAYPLHHPGRGRLRRPKMIDRDAQCLLSADNGVVQALSGKSKAEMQKKDLIDRIYAEAWNTEWIVNCQAVGTPKPR